MIHRCVGDHKTLVFLSCILFVATLAMSAGCGPEYEEQLHGSATFTLSGGVDEEINCDVRWKPMGPGYDGRRGSGEDLEQYKRVGFYCDNFSDDSLNISVIVWQQEDGSYPLGQGGYSTIGYSFDCPVDGPPCVVISYWRGEELYLSAPDQGTIRLDTVTDNEVAGSLDATLSLRRTSEDLNITGSFAAERREK